MLKKFLKESKLEKNMEAQREINRKLGYLIVEAETLNEMQKIIQGKLREGWTLTGSMFTHGDKFFRELKWLK